jgi:hypothetical protein
MRPLIRIALRNLAEPQAVARAACEKANAVARRFPAIMACRLELEGLERDAGFEAHVELLLPQHQIIVNRDHRDPKGALEAVFEAVGHELDLLAQRDRRFAPAQPAALAA